MTTDATSSQAGSGRITLQAHGKEAAFAELSCTYPLKLLSPRTPQDGVAVVYMLTYGGGLVGGDRIALSVDVGARTTLMLLSQGSTKVFKTRRGGRVSVQHGTPSPTGSMASSTQRMDVHVADGALLLLLPDPVTCFRAASYHQAQTFRLHGRASAVLLDWLTSGRRALGEEWAFARYCSVNEVFVDGTRVARDAMLLEEEGEGEAGAALPRRALGDRLAPYSCYATLILCGPAVADVVQALDDRYRAISVYKHRAAPELLWSLSAVAGVGGRIVRVAGRETEDVRTWLRESLSRLEGLLGADAIRRAFV